MLIEEGLKLVKWDQLHPALDIDVVGAVDDHQSLRLGPGGEGFLYFRSARRSRAVRDVSRSFMVCFRYLD